MAETVETIKNYLENYERTLSNEMDDMFWLCKADVSSLAEKLEKGELYIYSKDEYIKEIEELINDNVQYHIKNGLSKEEALDLASEDDFMEKLEDVKKSKCTVFIEHDSLDSYHEI